MNQESIKTKIVILFIMHIGANPVSASADGILAHLNQYQIPLTEIDQSCRGAYFYSICIVGAMTDSLIKSVVHGEQIELRSRKLTEIRHKDGGIIFKYQNSSETLSLSQVMYTIIQERIYKFIQDLHEGKTVKLGTAIEMNDTIQEFNNKGLFADSIQKTKFTDSLAFYNDNIFLAEYARNRYSQLKLAIASTTVSQEAIVTPGGEVDEVDTSGPAQDSVSSSTFQAEVARLHEQLAQAQSALELAAAKSRETSASLDEQRKLTEKKEAELQKEKKARLTAEQQLRIKEHELDDLQSQFTSESEARSAAETRVNILKDNTRKLILGARAAFKAMKEEIDLGRGEASERAQILQIAYADALMEARQSVEKTAAAWQKEKDDRIKAQQERDEKQAEVRRLEGKLEQEKNTGRRKIQVVREAFGREMAIAKEGLDKLIQAHSDGMKCANKKWHLEHNARLEAEKGREKSVMSIRALRRQRSAELVKFRTQFSTLRAETKAEVEKMEEEYAEAVSQSRTLAINTINNIIAEVDQIADALWTWKVPAGFDHSQQRCLPTEARVSLAWLDIRAGEAIAQHNKLLLAIQVVNNPPQNVKAGADNEGKDGLLQKWAADHPEVRDTFGGVLTAYSQYALSQQDYRNRLVIMVGEIEGVRKALAVNDNDLRLERDAHRGTKAELAQVRTQLQSLRAGRYNEFALIRLRMEQKLQKVAEIHQLELEALLAA